MYLYKLRWAHFDTLDEYEDMKMCQQIMHTEWIADSHEHLIEQIEEANQHKVKSISYMCSFDKPEQTTKGIKSGETQQNPSTMPEM